MIKETIHINFKGILELIIKFTIWMNPSYWFMNDRFNSKWDKLLNELMDTYEFTNIDEHTAMLGDTMVWIANHPYASFTFYGDNTNPHRLVLTDKRPSRYTIFKAKRKLDADRKLQDSYMVFDRHKDVVKQPILGNGIPKNWDGIN
jgi:hypothetical protein